MISYDVTRNVDTYVHRVGRTARAGKAGTAITFLEEKEVRESFFLCFENPRSLTFMFLFIGVSLQEALERSQQK